MARCGGACGDGVVLLRVDLPWNHVAVSAKPAVLEPSHSHLIAVPMDDMLTTTTTAPLDNHVFAKTMQKSASCTSVLAGISQRIRTGNRER